MDVKQESPRVRAAREALEAERAKTEAARAALDAERTSEDAELARLEEQRRQAERERVRLDREREAEPVFREAVRKYGGEHRVARIQTVNGPVILRSPTEAEMYDLAGRQAALENGVDRTKAAVEAVLEQTLFPTTDQLRAWLAEYPNLDGYLFAARNELVDGIQREARGKG